MSESITRISRREFCEGACQAASCAAAAALFSACGSGASSPTSPSPSSPSAPTATLGVLAGRFTGAGVQATVGTSALSQDGGAALVESNAGKFLVARTSASSFIAIDAVCSHEGCTVTEATGATYVCPCHGSRYSRSGQVLAGPATASLRQYPATFADGVVTITL